MNTKDDAFFNVTKEKRPKKEMTRKLPNSKLLCDRETNMIRTEFQIFTICVFNGHSL